MEAQSLDANVVNTNLTYTVPARTTARFAHLLVRINSGTPTLDLLLDIGAGLATFDSITADHNQMYAIPLSAGNRVRVNVAVAGGAGSTANVLIGVKEYPAPIRVSFGFGETAELDRGFTLPLSEGVQWIGRDMLGELITRELRLIADQSVDLSCVEIADP